jgi:hypothetical protein
MRWRRRSGWSWPRMPMAAGRRRRWRWWRRKSRRRRSRPAVAERGLHARRPPLGAAARRRHPLGVQRVGDGLQSQSPIPERRDPVHQLGRVMGEPRPPPPPLPPSRLPGPARDLAQHGGETTAGRGSRIQPDIERHKVSAGGLQPVQERDEVAQRAGHAAKLRRDNRARPPARQPVQHSRELGPLLAAVIVDNGRDVEARVVADHQLFVETAAPEGPDVDDRRAGSHPTIIRQ